MNEECSFKMNFHGNQHDCEKMINFLLQQQTTMMQVMDKLTKRIEVLEGGFRCSREISQK